MLTMFANIIMISAISLFAYAAYSDVRSLRIPNAICIAVALFGLLRLFLFWLFGDLTTGGVLETTSTAAIILLIGMVLFAFGFIGGGDAKLMAATVLLVGSHDLFPFLMIMSIFGAVLAAVMLALRHSPLPVYLGPRFAAFAFTTKVMVPYGVAIGVAATITLLAQLYFKTIPVTLAF